MATAKPPRPEPTHCVCCRQRLPTFNRFTLARAETGDLVFCRYACQERCRHQHQYRH